MVVLGCTFHQTTVFRRNHAITQPTSTISCSMQQVTSSNSIKVVINGATKEIGRAAIAAVTGARGMEVAGAVDSRCVGEDAGIVSNMDEPLEIPIVNDLTMVLGSIAQSRETGVVVDFTEPSTVYDNVKQAAAFGLYSVVYVPKIELETVTALSAFCEKATMGCLVAPTLSIGSVLLQQAAIQASFHYKNVEIVESRPHPSDLPSPEANQIANNLSNLGQIYNREDLSTDILTVFIEQSSKYVAQVEKMICDDMLLDLQSGYRSAIKMMRLLNVVKARGQVLGEDGVRVHSMVLPGIASSTAVNFSGPGEVYTIRHDITNVKALMPGLLLAIRRAVRLKNLVYGLEKFL